jgi:hypothetical protein
MEDSLKQFWKYGKKNAEMLQFEVHRAFQLHLPKLLRLL